MAELTILDVGHGNAAVLHEGNEAIVIDAGPGTGLLEFLVESGITHLAAVLISHADADHIKGLIALLGQEGLTVDSIHLNSDAAKASRLWGALAFELDGHQRRGALEFEVQLVEGKGFAFRSESRVDILAPRRALATLGPGSTDDQSRRITSNTVSAVARVSIRNGHTVLLAGDLDEVGLEHLLETVDDLRCDVLVFPHHGGNVSSGATPARNADFARALVSAVSPETVVFSIGRRSANRNPRPEIVAAVVEDRSRSVMCTQMSSACAPDGALVDLSHLSSAFAVGRSDSLCCAGSIRFDAGRRIEPPARTHAAFVEAWAPSAMCIAPQIQEHE